MKGNFFITENSVNRLGECRLIDNDICYLPSILFQSKKVLVSLQKKKKPHTGRHSITLYYIIPATKSGTYIIFLVAWS